MKSAVSFSISGAHAVAEWVPAPARPVIGAWWRNRSTEVAAADAARVVLAAHDDEALDARLDSLAAAFASTCERENLRGLAFEVRLGLDFARVGLMPVEGIAAKASSDAAMQTYIDAWVRHMLRLDPASQVTRWQLLADGRNLLISCIDRVVVDALDALATRQGMRLTSCRPAMLSMTVGGIRKDAGGTIVLTEAGKHSHRSSLVQMMQLQRGQIVRVWRGWIPYATPTAADVSLDSAVRRFNATPPGAPDVPVEHVRWPAVARSSAQLRTV
ncbi:MAG: hypothetical protein JWQ07_117 [Ramlibacter sp.]|nr:hypothetical protein [Ramlibacter sp.]